MKNNKTDVCKIFNCNISLLKYFQEQEIYIKVSCSTIEVVVNTMSVYLFILNYLKKCLGSGKELVMDHEH